MKEGNIILGLDISTSCIGVSIVYDDGLNKPKIIKITHVVPKIPNKISGIEALILRKKIFEEEFLVGIKDLGISECVIEAPLKYASCNSNAETISQLLQFNGLISEAVYRVLGIVPNYISSYDARMYAFPKLLSIRKFNKKGIIYPYKHIIKSIEDNHLILFGDFPFDCDKKSVVMNCVCEEYPDINWVYDKKGRMKKENFDACDSLVCLLAYINKKRYGELKANIVEYLSSEGEDISISYSVSFWGNLINKEIRIPLSNE